MSRWCAGCFVDYNLQKTFEDMGSLISTVTGWLTACMQLACRWQFCAPLSVYAPARVQHNVNGGLMTLHDFTEAFDDKGTNNVDFAVREA